MAALANPFELDTATKIRNLFAHFGGRCLRLYGSTEYWKFPNWTAASRASGVLGMLWLDSPGNPLDTTSYNSRESEISLTWMKDVEPLEANHE